MSAISLQGNASGTGTLTVAAPSTNTNRTLTLPDGTGTFSVAGVNSNIVASTSQNSTSGTSIDFTSIPTWVKRITVMLNGVSTSGTSLVQIQVGSGSVSTSSYVTGSGFFANASGSVTAAYTSGLVFEGGAGGSAAYLRYGIITITNISSNIWVFGIQGYLSSAGTVAPVAGGGVSPTLSGALDRVRITTVNGTDTFDAGSINILYE